MRIIRDGEVQNGSVFGHWEVLVARTDTPRKARCRCQCGKVKLVARKDLWSGKSTNCGCKKQPARRTHGESNSRLHRIWKAMNTRCTNPKSTSYHRYGGRGISVCDEWRHNYTSFAAWARAHGYNDNLTLDRKNNDGPYSRENCRWVTPQENCSNTSRSRSITKEATGNGAGLFAFGESKKILEWARDSRCAVGYTTLKGRLQKGWEAEKAIITPKVLPGKKTPHRGHGESLTRLYGIWSKMIRRCTVPKDKAYRLYGGRGISVSDEWLEYTTFRDWALLHGYAEDLTIDRTDVNGHYSPENCRWVTPRQNNRNTRWCKPVTAFGETKLLTDWIADPRCFLKSITALQQRLAKGYTPESAISLPDLRRKGCPLFDTLK